MSEAEGTMQGPPVAAGGPRRWGLDLRGRVILVLLVVGALSALATSWLGFQSGRENLTERISAQLAGRRDVVASAIERDFSMMRAHVRALTDDATVQTALHQLSMSVPQIENERPMAEIDAELTAWYEREFLSRLPVDDSVVPVAEAFLPSEPRARVLQSRYVIPERGDREAAFERVPAARLDGYERVLRRIEPTFAALADALDYHDIFLIAPDGTILYTAAKEVDLGTNLIDGPYALSGLARAFAAAREERGEGFVHVEDFDFYRPSFGTPAAFLSAPVYDGSELRGVVAVQIAPERITGLLGGDAGLGDLGEAFVVGIDGRARSDLRSFREDPAAFLAVMREARGETEALDRMERTGTTILNLEIVSPVIAEASRGRSGVTLLDTNYRSVAALAAYSPLDIPGLDWVMKVEQPVSEALAPIENFQRSILITAVGLAIAITLFSMWAAGWFTKPLRELTDRAHQVAEGDLDVPMRLERADEFGELSEAMQTMTHELKARRDTADAARLQTEALLGRFLPAGIVREVKERDPETDEFNIVDEVESVSVVAAELTGYDVMMENTPPLEAIAALDKLVQLIDDAADRVGIEKVRTVGATYLAVAGLSAPQLDHMQRAIAFARELHAIIQRFRRESGVPLGVHIGIASGPIVAGVIGRHRLSFDMYGPAIAEAEALRDAAAPGEIRLGAMTIDVLGHAVDTDPAPDGRGRLLRLTAASTAGNDDRTNGAPRPDAEAAE